MQASNEYIPGVCNIGPNEIKRRRIATIFSIILTVVVLVLILVLHAERIWRLTLIIPVAALAINFQQVYFKFCVNFGWRGFFNFGDPGKHDPVEQSEFRKEDRRKAIQMIVVGIIVGAVSALIFYTFPI